jgi:hypothetical protein
LNASAPPALHDYRVPIAGRLASRTSALELGDVGLDERVEAVQLVPRQAREVLVDLPRLPGRRCVGAGRPH